MTVPGDGDDSARRLDMTVPGDGGDNVHSLGPHHVRVLAGTARRVVPGVHQAAIFETTKSVSKIQKMFDSTAAEPS